MSAQDFASDATADSIKAFLNNNVDVDKQRAAIVIGIIDESGSRIITHGQLDNGTTRQLDGDSIFFIGSVTKTFTALLLLDMVDRGKMNLNDPVAMHLPAAVKVPSRGGKEISLLHLATHTAGLPINPDNMTGADEREQYETYTTEKMYAFLSGCKLNSDPGTQFEYSNLGMALLGHAMALRAGKPFETLVVERICQPLGMDSTCITLTPEQQERLAMGHDEAGNASPPWRFGAYSPAGNVHSSANDLLKYVSAQSQTTNSSLTSLMKQSHMFRNQDAVGLPSQGSYGRLGRTAMPWVDRGAYQPPGMELLGHAGGAGSYHAWVGFDKKQRRGVVVLSTANDLSVEAIGWTILQRVPLVPDRKTLFMREMVGIGAALETDKDTGMIRVTRVFANSPAAQAGVPAGVIILKIDDVSTAGKGLTECLDLIRGPAGSKVRLELSDPQLGKTSVVEVTRDKFLLST
jgi:D-alanyl-D-alanine-carboxypeptidase/D-alanyl-D-alanine-endopeptidase